MKRAAFAMWQGGVKNGHGNFAIENSSFNNIPYSYKSRFESERDLSPEGLLAAAHAASFAMSFAKKLETMGFNDERIDTVATVHVEEVAGLPTITHVDLELTVHTALSNHVEVKEAANLARDDCSISRLFNAQVSLNIKIQTPAHYSAA